MSALYIFRRDLRTQDNIGLIEATKKYGNVYCIFIMTPEQLDKNPYKTESAIQFMHETLKELSNEINITFYYGNPKKIINKVLLKNKKIKEIFVNSDYTKYAVNRDLNISQICKKNNVLFSSFHDHLLNEPNAVLTANGKYYSKFTPYYKKAITLNVKTPQDVKHKNFLKLNDGISLDKLSSFYNKNDSPMIKGSRKEALKHLVLKNNYSKNRDKLTYETTFLSAYIKFGCVSIREVYHKYKDNESLSRQLYWQDFYTIVGYNNLDYTEKRVYQPKEDIKWMNGDKFDAWKKGLTGFPIVDATMRQLNKEKYCHNRGRLIASGFIKFMFMDWRIAEKYYAQNLRDYSPAINYHNWCWSMSFGAFSTPYFRIMNVWIQGKKHDPDAVYIKRWVPELKDVPPKDIHKWNEVNGKYAKSINYPKPIVNYNEQRAKSMSEYKKMNS